MPTSRDPRKRERQLANLRRGGGVTPTVGGHRPNLRHGAYAAVAEATLEEKTLEVFRALAEDGERVLTVADAPLVRLAAEVMCRLASISTYLAAHGWLDAKGQPRESLLDLERRLRAEAADHLDALGASPRSRAKLGLDVARGAAAALDLAEVWAEQDHEPDAPAPIEGTATDA